MYENNSKKMGLNNIFIPYAFWKMIYNDENLFKKCFYVENKEDNTKTIQELEMECRKVHDKGFLREVF